MCKGNNNPLAKRIGHDPLHEEDVDGCKRIEQEKKMKAFLRWEGEKGGKKEKKKQLGQENWYTWHNLIS